MLDLKILEITFLKRLTVYNMLCYKCLIEMHNHVLEKNEIVKIYKSSFTKRFLTYPSNLMMINCIMTILTYLLSNKELYSIRKISTSPPYILG